MPEEKLIELIFGPYRDQRVSIAADEADKAIAEGWARDPFAPPDEMTKQSLSDKELVEMWELAEKAARRWRGERSAKPQLAEKRALEAEEGEEGYQTRDVKRGPGRPPKGK